LRLLAAFIICSLLMPKAFAENIYFTAQGKQNGKPVIYRSMQAVPKGQLEADYPNLINIYWSFDVDSNNGMPDRSSNEKQIAFEDAIESLDANGVSHLMLVVTGNGRKEWIWYVKDVDKWIGQLNTLLAGHEVYPIEINIEKEPTWSTYHSFVSSVGGR